MQTVQATDHTAVNWQGDPETLSTEDVLARLTALANYAELHEHYLSGRIGASSRGDHE